MIFKSDLMPLKVKWLSENTSTSVLAFSRTMFIKNDNLLIAADGFIVVDSGEFCERRF